LVECCESLLFEKLHVKSLDLGEVINETLGNLFSSVANKNNDEVVFLHVDMRVLAHNFIVLEHTSHGILEFSFIFIVHGDARHQLWIGSMVMVISLETTNGAVAKYRSNLAVLHKTTWHKCVVYGIGLNH
jgi:hypothetical protein